VVASLAATMGGIDALVFTGGIGENVESLRLMILQGTRFLGILADNVLVVPAQEEQQMLNELLDLVLKQ
jgi:acetate kinase